MPGYLYFFLALTLLILGYYFYSRLVERIYNPNFEKTPPALRKHDGVDFVALPPWKIFLIQLLNIAGLGPIFGALSGALFGPCALIWIVVGCILGGAVHDFLSGLLSVRHSGDNLPEIIGRYLGNPAKHSLRYLCIILSALVGVVFVMGPAAILADISPLNMTTWAIIIFAYYFLATILPIQTLIGRIYPLFGAILIFMAIGVISMLFYKGYHILPNTEFFTNQQPAGQSVWPMLFVTIACGAISGFHATQSPMMARCLPHVRLARPLFYGPMIAEGIIALIWATVGLSFYNSQADFASAMQGTPAAVVKETCVKLLGSAGAVVALVGVVILPITSGDTALRCARLIIADIFKSNQKPILNRLYIALPLFACCILLTQVEFNVIWRYFGWVNQIIATLTLWTISVFLIRRKSFHWITTLPALFMTAMCMTYGLNDKSCLGLSLTLSTTISLCFSGAMLILFLYKGKNTVPPTED